MDLYHAPYLYNITQLKRDFSTKLNWNQRVHDKAYSFFHPIDDKNFEQTDLFLYNCTVLLDADTLVDNVLEASYKLCNDALEQGAEPFAFVLDVAASWPEMSPTNFPWRELLPQLAEGFATMGMPVSIGNVRALSRTDAAFQYDSFSILLVSKRVVDYQDQVVFRWPMFSMSPYNDVYHGDSKRIRKGLFVALREMAKKRKLRFAAKLDSSVDVFPKAVLVCKRGLEINVDGIIPDLPLIITEEAYSVEVIKIAKKWGFAMFMAGYAKLGSDIVILQNDIITASYIKPAPKEAVEYSFAEPVLEACSCHYSTWLPEQEEDDAEAFRELALSVFFHPMHLGKLALERIFDSTANQVIPTNNYLQDAVVIRYRDVFDIFGLNYQWIPKRVGLDSCHLQEYLANAIRELICSGISPKVVAASFVEKIDFHRQSCIQQFCSDFGLTYKAQVYPNYQNVNWQTGMGLVVLGDPIHVNLPQNQSFKRKGDLIFIIGRSISNLSGSVFQLVSQTGEVGAIPPVDMEMEKQIVDLLKLLWKQQLIEMACNIGRGGLFTALTNSALVGNVGFDVTTDSELRSDSFLFSEAPGRVIVSVNNELEAQFIDVLMESNIPFSLLGHITKDELRIDDLSYGFVADFKQMMLQGWNAALRG